MKKVSRCFGCGRDIYTNENNLCKRCSREGLVMEENINLEEI
jgi:rRNA maturation endonuclease Nob1